MILHPTIARFPASVTKLTSGLTVIHQQLQAAPVVVVDVWVKAGSIAEPDHWSGMAHFLEHMIFKGSDRLPVGRFDYEVESRGGISNAATGQDYAHFFILTAKEHLPDGLPLLADILLHPALPEEEFLRERDVVLEEIYQAQDDPDWLGFQALMEDVYRHHAYGRSVLGSEEKLLAMTPDDMRQFHAAHYQPENLTVVITGDISQEEALELVQSSFTGFPSRPNHPYFEPDAEPPITAIRRQELYLPRLEQARLLMAWTGPGLNNHAPIEHLIDQLRRSYGLDLLSALLSDGRTSRLVRELREERQLVQDISTTFSLQRDSSLLTLTAWLDVEHLDRVEAILCDRLSELQTKPISEAELQRCQRLLCNDFAFSCETPDQIAGLYGYYSILAKPELSVIYPDQVRSLSPIYLQNLASQILSPYHYAVTLLKPA